LPEGTVPVAIGLVVSGISSYAFFKVGQQALGKEDFKPIVALWFAMFALSPGFFIPLEQELGRALAHRRALGQGGRPVVARMLPLAAGLTTTVSLLVLLAGPWATDDLFEGYWLVSFALIVAFVSYAPMHLARGVCSGSGRFAAYGVVMAADGVVKIVGCVALWLLGIDTVESYAFVVALSPWVGVLLVASRGQLHTTDGPPADFSEITPNIGWLLGGSIVAAALVNAGPLAVDILADSTPGQQAQVTAFGNGVLLSRVPLFLFQAVQAALLPRLARLAARGNLDLFREGFRRLMVIVILVGAIGTAGAALVGPQVLDLVYDGGLGRQSLTLLAAASALYMIATATAQAVIALSGHPWVTFGWISGMSTFLVVTAFSADDVFLRVELGLVAGSAVALTVFVTGLRARVAAGAVPDVESVIDGVFDNTIEG
jgi:O-antigen/teichoic acid export membrane protein